MRLSPLHAAALALTLFSAAPALASDYGGIPDLRPSTFDVYVGAFAAGTSVQTTIKDEYGGRTDLNGTGFAGGVRAGVDYGSDGWLVGIVGDWTFGGKVAGKDDSSLTFDVSDIGTARIRAGAKIGDAVIYATGGYAGAEMKLQEEYAGLGMNDSGWAEGWTLGAGLDYMLTDSLSLGVEYLFISLDDMKYQAKDKSGDIYVYKHQLDAIHAVRVGMNYAFQI